MSNIKDFATGIIATAPSPASSGTTASVETGHGSRLPAVPFYATVVPEGTLSTLDTAEVWLVEAKSGDDLSSITRAQKGTSAQDVAVGWRITNAIYADDVVQGPDSSTDNAIARYDGTTGKLIQDSAATVNDTTGAINALDFNASNQVVVDNSVLTDTISERTTGTGVTIDSVLLKDGNVDGVDVSGVANDATATLTNKTINSSNNTISLTMSTVSDAGDLATLDVAGLNDIEYFTSSGTWTKPDNLKFILVFVNGPGGGGGGAGTTGGGGEMAQGNAGGGGGYSFKKIAAASLGSTETVTVGTGGSGGSSSGGNGTGGSGASSFGSHASGSAGARGNGRTASSSTTAGIGRTVSFDGGTGGSASSGDINISGGTGTGTTGGASSGPFGGSGGSTNYNAAGTNGSLYGGGGGSSHTSPSNTGNTGGSGANGIVVVYEYF